ncbi:MAG: gas vesicle protein GvpG [Methylococcaceae bacterium]
MLLVDDILFSPIKGINWIFKKIHALAEEELTGEADRLRESLTELYMLLETGQITEEEFELQETLLLDKLDALDEDQQMIGDADDEDDEDEDDSDDEDDEEDDDEVEDDDFEDDEDESL